MNLPDSTPSYLLIYNPPTDPTDGHGLGWSLVIFESGRRRRCINLAAHGAAATAGLAIAQAVATRVLADRGITTRGWTTSDRGSTAEPSSEGWSPSIPG
jgi:hypothetical protein